MDIIEPDYPSTAFEAILTTPTLCDDCEQHNTCKTGYACADFMRFVNTGESIHKDRTPQRKYFQYLFPTPYIKKPAPKKRAYNRKKNSKANISE